MKQTVRQYIKLLILIFVAGFIVATLGCKKEAPIQSCPITIDDVDTIAYNGEIVEPTRTEDFMLQIPVDIYFFIDSTKYTAMSDSDIQLMLDKVNKTMARVYKDGKMIEGPHYLKFFPRNKAVSHSTRTLEEYFHDQNIRDTLIENQIDDWDHAINLIFFESTSSLNGYAPTLANNLSDLEHLKYNNAWVELDSFDIYASTISHEIGHLLGLNHPFELKRKAPERFEKLNLNYYYVQYNLMNYGCYTDHVTIEQLSAMYLFLITYRDNWISGFKDEA